MNTVMNVRVPQNAWNFFVCFFFGPDKEVYGVSVRTLLHGVSQVIS